MNAFVPTQFEDLLSFDATAEPTSRASGPQPLIRTGRLTLRRVERRDAPEIAEALSNYHVARMLTRVPQPFHVEDAEEWLDQVLDDQHNGWLFAITLGGIRAILAPGHAAANGNEAGRLVGFVSIEWCKSRERVGWHIGYWLDETHWGKGIMTDAVNAVLARFFALHMGEVLYSCVMADNPASLRLQGKLGFDVTGVEDIYSASRSETVRTILTEVSFGGYMPN